MKSVCQRAWWFSVASLLAACPTPPPNPQPPVAVADAFQLTEDTTATIAASQGVLANDDPVEAGALTAVLDTGPAHGTLTLEADGSFTYVPALNFSGQDSFAYHAERGSLASSPATVTLTVAPAPDPPVAVGNGYSVWEDAPSAMAGAPGVLGNDTDADGDPLTAVLITDVSHGLLILSADGSFSYMPSPDFFGSDSFTYAANDGANQSAPATVTFAVTSVNDLPVATAVGPITTAEDTAAAAVQLTGTDVEDPVGMLTASVATPPQHGVLSPSSGAPPLAVTYTPAANYAGPDSFTFAIVDRNAGSSSLQTVNVTVTPLNDPPVAQADSPTAYQGVSIDIPVLANDTDVDSVALTVTGATQPSQGTTSFAADHVTYTPAPGYTGPDSFTYTIQDDVGAPASATVNVTVAPGCCNVFVGCSGVCENDLGPMSPRIQSEALRIIDNAPRTVHWTVDNTPVSGSVATLHYDSYGAGGWTSQAVGSVTLPFDVASDITRLFVDNAEPVVVSALNDVYSQNAYAVVFVERVGGVWQTPSLIINTFVSSGGFDMMFEMSYARVGSTPTIAFYALVNSGGFWRRYTYVTRRTGGVWGSPTRIVSIGESGFAPFLSAYNGYASIIHGGGPIYWSLDGPSGWTTTNLTAALGLTSNARRASASTVDGTTTVHPNGGPALAYTDGTAAPAERVQYAYRNGNAWAVETAADVGAASTNGGITVATPIIEFMSGNASVVYERIAGSGTPALSTIWLNRRAGPGVWTARNLLGPDVNAAAARPIGVGYLFLGLQAVDTATTPNGWFDAWAHVCAGPECPAGGCGNGLHDGREVDSDCGGGTCGVCSNAQTCLANADCSTGKCISGLCTP